MYSLINHVISGSKFYRLASNLNIKFNTLSPIRLFNRSPIFKSPAEINTNVAKDVILFHYENPRFYKIINICAVSQYIFWQYVGYVGYKSSDSLKAIAKNLPEDAPWYNKIFTGNYKYALFATAIIVGSSTLIFTWMFTLRSIRYLVLHKGGGSVSVITYTPFGQNRIMKVPLTQMSCALTRSSAKSQLPIKVKGRIFHYLLDMRGEFKSPTLFDHSAGLKRNLNYSL